MLFVNNSAYMFCLFFSLFLSKSQSRFNPTVKKQSQLKKNVASRGGLANRQLPSGKSKSLSNSSSDCGLDESEDEPNDYVGHGVLITNTGESQSSTVTFTNGHHRQPPLMGNQPPLSSSSSTSSPPQSTSQQQQQPQPAQTSSPLYAQVHKDRDSQRSVDSGAATGHSTIPNTYRALADSSHGSYATDLNSSYDSILGSNDKLSDSGGSLSDNNWPGNHSRGRPKGFKTPFAQGLSQVLEKR